MSISKINLHVPLADFITDVNNFSSNNIEFFINNSLQPSEMDDILINLWKPDRLFVFWISENYFTIMTSPLQKIKIK